MKRLMITTAAIAATLLAAPARSADVGVSISIGQPGFYGRLDIGGYPPPQLIYAQPVMVEPVPPGRPPIYLRVPPGYVKHWNRYCHEYHACGERVFFVQDRWYNREFAPRYQERHREEFRHEGHRDERPDSFRHEEHRRDERRDERDRGR